MNKLGVIELVVAGTREQYDDYVLCNQPKHSVYVQTVNDVGGYNRQDVRVVWTGGWWENPMMDSLECLWQLARLT